MNLGPLKQVFQTEAASVTGTVLTLPSGLSKGMALTVVDKVDFEPILKSLATILAQEVGGQLLSGALRPPDYADIREIPDTLIEYLIEALAKKPDVFFDTFRQNLKIQG